MNKNDNKPIKPGFEGLRKMKGKNTFLIKQLKN